MAPLAARVRRVEPAAFTKVSALGVEEQRVNVVLDFVEGLERVQTLGDGFRVEAQIITYTAAEAVGRPVTMLIPPERQGEEPALLERLRRGERIEHFETVRVTRDSRRLDISLTISPVRDAEGRVLAASKVARDITELKANINIADIGKEVFPVVMLLLIVAFCGEHLVANRFYEADSDAAGAVSESPVAPGRVREAAEPAAIG